jgi:hypothetical protein
VAKQLEALLKMLQSSDEGGVSDLIWLFERCILSMVDHDYLISKFEKYMLMTPLQLSD